MKTIRFSIIVVCLNAGDKLSKTVDSILTQTYQNAEIIVKDGMSTDGSVERLPDDPRIRILRQRDTGIYDAMNQGIGMAEGDYLLFLNCGDYFYDYKVLEKVNAWIATDKCASEIYYGDIFNRLNGARISSNPVINDFACYRNVPCHQACFYSGELMKKRQYRPEYMVRADYEHFLWSYFKEGVHPVYMDICICSYEGGGYSETAENRRRSEWERREIMDQYMTRAQIRKYDLLMKLSMASLRTKIAENPHLAGAYNKVKEMVYRGKKK